MCEKGEWEGRGSIRYSRHLCHRYMSTMRFYYGLPQLHSDHCVCLECRQRERERTNKKRQQNRVKDKCLRRWNWKGQGDSERWKPFRCCAADRVVCHWGFGQARVGSVLLLRSVSRSTTSFFFIGVAGEFSSPGSTFCADCYFGIRSTLVLPQ